MKRPPYPAPILMADNQKVEEVARNDRNRNPNDSKLAVTIRMIMRAVMGDFEGISHSAPNTSRPIVELRAKSDSCVDELGIIFGVIVPCKD